MVFLAVALQAQTRPEVVIAAASNLTDVFRELGASFERETGVHPVFNFASTGVLAKQAEHGAPFDVIAAADDEHIAELERQSLLAPGSRAVYAFGTLALWVPSKFAQVRQLTDLVSSEIKVIAIPKPELAPYGAAAIEALKSVGIWDRVRGKVVYAENVTMAKQYGVSGNADAVLTAYPVVLHEAGLVIPVSGKRHAPIVQSLGILARTADRRSAEAFTNYVLRGTGRDLLEKYGYTLPSVGEKPRR